MSHIGLTERTSTITLLAMIHISIATRDVSLVFVQKTVLPKYLKIKRYVLLILLIAMHLCDLLYPDSTQLHVPHPQVTLEGMYKSNSCK